MPTVTKNRQRAFTIVEVLVAIAILVFGLGVIYEYMVDSAQSGNRGIERMQVRWLAHERLAELRSAPYASLKAWTPGARVPMSDRLSPERVCNAAAKIATLPDGSIEISVEAAAFEKGSDKPINAVTVKGVVAP